MLQNSFFPGLHQMYMAEHTAALRYATAENVLGLGDRGKMDFSNLDWAVHMFEEQRQCITHQRDFISTTLH